MQGSSVLASRPQLRPGDAGDFRSLTAQRQDEALSSLHKNRCGLAAGAKRRRHER